ncbi:MAG: nucleotidyltransferase family protein [Candidatus Omnitrophica bacterium]|nr:nucleotidyltransferase family protein [Candidatus Omnitrophota bacterium]
MRIIFLAGGFGSRLYPITQVTSKSLIDLGEKPMLDHMMSVVHEIKDRRETVIVTNEMFFDDFSRWKEERGTGEIEIINNGVRNRKQKLGIVKDMYLGMKDSKEDFLVLSPDNFFDFPVAEFLRHIRWARVLPLIGVYDLKNKSQAGNFDVVKLDGSGEVVNIEEQPFEPQSGLVSIGLYYFPNEFMSKVREYLEVEKNDPDRMGNFIGWLLVRNAVYGHIFQGNWFDVGDAYELQEAREHYWKNKFRGDKRIRQDSYGQSKKIEVSP